MVGKPRIRPVDPAIPDFMRADAGSGTENIPYEDIGWYPDVADEANSYGSTGRSNNDDLHEMRPLIDSILLAIILATTSIERAPKALSRARRALGLSADESGQPGRLANIDDVYIAKISNRYHSKTYEDITRNVDLDTIIKKVIQEELGEGVAWDARDWAKLKRLRQKFKDQRDAYLSAVNTADDWERAPRLLAARRILSDLPRIGVAVRLDHLDLALVESSLRRSG